MSCTKTCVAPTPAQAHCPVCHITFGGVRLFDAHRAGTLDAPVCCPPDSIPGFPAHLVNGVWRRLMLRRPTHWAIPAAR